VIVTSMIRYQSTGSI